MSYTLHRMTEADAPLTAEWMVRQYGFGRDEVGLWLRDFRFNWPLSVKALDASGRVVGLLNMSDYRIEEETPFIVDEKPRLLATLNAMRYTAVFSFIVAPDYRGSRLNYDMFSSILPELRLACDFIFIPVMHHLKTHRYWQRWGAREFYRDPNCVYYMLPLTEKIIDIYHKEASERLNLNNPTLGPQAQCGGATTNSIHASRRDAISINGEEPIAVNKS